MREIAKSMYGARDAAQNWEFAYSDWLVSIGFEIGRSVSCMFWHPTKNIRVVVHGDDFTVLGTPDQLDWFRKVSVLNM